MPGIPSAGWSVDQVCDIAGIRFVATRTDGSPTQHHTVPDPPAVSAPEGCWKVTWRRVDTSGVACAYIPPRRVHRFRYHAATGVLQALHSVGGCLEVPLPRTTPGAPTPATSSTSNAGTQTRAEKLRELASLAAMAGIPHNLPDPGGTQPLPNALYGRIQERTRQQKSLQCQIPSPDELSAAEGNEKEYNALLERKGWLLQRIDEIGSATLRELRSEQERRLDLRCRIRAEQEEKEKRFSALQDNRAVKSLRLAQDASISRQSVARERQDKWRQRAAESGQRAFEQAMGRAERSRQLSERRDRILMQYEEQRHLTCEKFRTRAKEFADRVDEMHRQVEKRADDIRNKHNEKVMVRNEKIREIAEKRDNSRSDREPERDRSGPARELAAKRQQWIQEEEEKCARLRAAHRDKLDDRAQAQKDLNTEREALANSNQQNLFNTKRKKQENREEERQMRYHKMDEQNQQKLKACEKSRLQHCEFLRRKRQEADRRSAVREEERAAEQRERCKKKSERAHCVQSSSDALLSPLARSPLVPSPVRPVTCPPPHTANSC